MFNFLLEPRGCRVAAAGRQAEGLPQGCGGLPQGSHRLPQGYRRAAAGLPQGGMPPEKKPR